MSLASDLLCGFARRVVLASACSGFLVANPAQAAGPTGLLNDTGQTLCDNGGRVMVACSNANTGDHSTMPSQDGRFGRDVATPSKVGDGAAGFDFTKVCMNGTQNCTGAANTGASPAANEWACTKDNVTNLIWSLQTQFATWNDAMAAIYPDAGHNDLTRCGFNSGWRLPKRRELLSILHHGQFLLNTAMIDETYFPGTSKNYYWASDSVAKNWDIAWIVGFDKGDIDADYKEYSFYVRLVRSGQ